jgi:hypothetical protein
MSAQKNTAQTKTGPLSNKKVGPFFLLIYYASKIIGLYSRTAIGFDSLNCLIKHVRYFFTECINCISRCLTSFCLNVILHLTSNYQRFSCHNFLLLLLFSVHKSIQIYPLVMGSQNICFAPLLFTYTLIVLSDSIGETLLETNPHRPIRTRQSFLRFL